MVEFYVHFYGKISRKYVRRNSAKNVWLAEIWAEFFSEPAEIDKKIIQLRILYPV